MFTSSAIAASPTATLVLNLKNQFPFATQATVAFLSDESIAVSGYPGSDTSSFVGAIAVFQWRNAALRLSALTHPPLDAPTPGRGLFAVAHGNLLFNTRKPQLWSSDLKSSLELPMRIAVPPVQPASVVAEYHSKSWTLYRLAPNASFLREGGGTIMSLSDDFVAFRTERELRIETLAGKVAGQFQIPPESVCYSEAVLLGPGRLFLLSCGDYRIVDFNGKMLVKIPAPDGWGARYGTSRDGGRLLFDHFTRRMSMAQRFGEWIDSAISLGMGPVVTDKGEDIRVVDTLTGKMCFELDSPDRLFGVVGHYHADLSPSGHLVAVVVTNPTTITLSVYEMPTACTLQ